MSGGAPPGARSNGVPVSSWWAALGGCDPRVTGEVLGLLADAGIAAYAQPDGGNRGSYLEVHPPRRPLDLLSVEGNRHDEALKLVGHRLGDHTGSEDATFAAIVAGFHDTPSLPASGKDGTERDLDATTFRPPTTSYQRTIRDVRSTEPPGLLDPGGLLGDTPAGQDPFAGDDEHFVPPKVGKAPPVHPLTRLAVIAICVGVALVVAPSLWGFSDTTTAYTVGVALIGGGVVRLIGRLRDDPPDEDPEGGAVV